MPLVSGSAVTTVLFVALIATFLFVAREVLIPIALAILLSFVCLPSSDFWSVVISPAVCPLLWLWRSHLVSYSRSEACSLRK